MKRGSSILWIIVLLAALFIGPAFTVDDNPAGEEIPSLRAIIAQERLIDAPAPLPAPPTFP